MTHIILWICIFSVFSFKHYISNVFHWNIVKIIIQSKGLYILLKNRCNTFNYYESFFIIILLKKINNIVAHLHFPYFPFLWFVEIKMFFDPWFVPSGHCNLIARLEFFIVFCLSCAVIFKQFSKLREII